MNDFQKIYLKGKTLYSSENKLKVIYYVESSLDQIGVKAAFVVSRKSGNAVWRNRIKRLLRESYRRNKHELLNLSCSKNLLLLLSFSPGSLNQRVNRVVKLDFIREDVIELLEIIKKKIENE